MESSSMSSFRSPDPAVNSQNNQEIFNVIFKVIVDVNWRFKYASVGVHWLFGRCRCVQHCWIYFVCRQIMLLIFPLRQHGQPAVFCAFICWSDIKISHGKLFHQIFYRRCLIFTMKSFFKKNPSLRRVVENAFSNLSYRFRLCEGSWLVP